MTSTQVKEVANIIISLASQVDNDEALVRELKAMASNMISINQYQEQIEMYKSIIESKQVKLVRNIEKVKALIAANAAADDTTTEPTEDGTTEGGDNTTTPTDDTTTTDTGTETTEGGDDTTTTPTDDTISGDEPVDDSI